MPIHSAHWNVSKATGPVGELPRISVGPATKDVLALNRISSLDQKPLVSGSPTMAAQAATDAAQRGVSAIDSHTRDAAGDQWDPNALGPGEVRR